MSAGRNTSRRDKHRAALAKNKPPCHHCGDDIDWTAGHLHPLAFQVDHVTPLSRGGTDTLDNCVAAHRKCNRDKSDKPPHPQGVTYTTERQWWH